MIMILIKEDICIPNMIKIDVQTSDVVHETKIRMPTVTPKTEYHKYKDNFMKFVSM